MTALKINVFFNKWIMVNVSQNPNKPGDSNYYLQPKNFYYAYIQHMLPTSIPCPYYLMLL